MKDENPKSEPKGSGWKLGKFEPLIKWRHAPDLINHEYTEAGV